MTFFFLSLSLFFLLELFLLEVIDARIGVITWLVTSGFGVVGRGIHHYSLEFLISVFFLHLSA